LGNGKGHRDPEEKKAKGLRDLADGFLFEEGTHQIGDHRQKGKDEKRQTQGPHRSCG
jgi:hypothetical protein